jgi:hypothetical protein
VRALLPCGRVSGVLEVGQIGQSGRNVCWRGVAAAPDAALIVARSGHFPDARPPYVPRGDPQRGQSATIRSARDPQRRQSAAVGSAGDPRREHPAAVRTAGRPTARTVGHWTFREEIHIASNRRLDVSQGDPHHRQSAAARSVGDHFADSRCLHVPRRDGTGGSGPPRPRTSQPAGPARAWLTNPACSELSRRHPARQGRESAPCRPPTTRRRQRGEGRWDCAPPPTDPARHAVGGP